MSEALDADLASRLATVALDNVVREFPNKLDHLMTSAADVQRPRVLHPVFYGSYDWHSSVHMHWTLVTLRTRFPALPESAAIADHLDAHLAADRIGAERAYLAGPGAASFERPYGWAWLLKLSQALHVAARTDPRAVAWRDHLQPLTDDFVRRVHAFLPRAIFPSRAGSHANSAFALLLMRDYAGTVGDAPLAALLEAKARDWYADDRDYPVAYETCSEDFLSNGLLEAVLMRRVLGDASAFDAWWQRFMPDAGRIRPWLTPVVPSDRSDARLSHIDGLNLSRAWCWSMLIDALPAAMPASTSASMPASLHADIRAAIAAHLGESLPHAAHGHYVGTHWLASFALLALGA